MLVDRSAFISHKGAMMSILQQWTARCIPTEWQVPLDLSPAPMHGSNKRLWIDPVAFINLLNGWQLAQWAIQMNRRLQFRALPKPVGPGAPQTYRDESVLLTSL